MSGTADDATVSEIVTALQDADEVGAIFTRTAPPSGAEGWVRGTLSFETARWAHARSADILFSPNWTAEPNEHGYPGAVMTGGVAGHGSSSPYDVHNTLIAAGPDVKEGVEVSTPTGNVDLAPTILSLLGLEIPATMQGRVLAEALGDGPDPSSIMVETRTLQAETEDGNFSVTAHVSEVDGRRYLDYTEVERR